MRALGKSGDYTFYAAEQLKLPAVMFDAAVSAGFPSPALDYMEEEIDLAQQFNLNSPTVFIVKVVGDSMREAHIVNKSYIAVDMSIKPQHRHIVVGMLNGDFTIKRLLKTDAGYMLHPENPMYPNYVIKDEDQFEVWGVVTRIFIDPNACL